MSKNIIIQEGGVGRQFTASKLKTALVGGGSAQWVPRENALMAAVEIHKNGRYTAQRLGVNGIVEAKVDGKGGTAITVTRRDLLGSLPTLTPAILEGGKPLNFSAHTLKVAEQGGGEALFVPDDMPMGEKVITKPGKYRAGSDGLYAWNSLNVALDGGGTDFGELVDHIAVTTPPTQLEYGDGAYISYDGIVVTAYNEDDEALGVIPFEELILPMEVAEYPGNPPIYHTEPVEASYVYYRYGLTFSFEAVGLYYRFPGNLDSAKREHVLDGDGTIYAVIEANPNDSYEGVHAASLKPYRILTYENERLTGTRNATQHTQWGLTYYYSSTQVNRNRIPLPKIEDTRSPLPQYTGHDMVFFGEGGAGGNVDVPVQWKRPEDSRILESTFMISVLNLSGGQGDD